MSSNNLAEMIKQSGISKDTSVIMKSIRPAIDIIKNIDNEPYLGCSRFGGAPDLDVDTEWPTYNNKPYRFLGQINFSEMTGVDTDFPKSGLLSIFFDEYSDDESYLETWEPGYIRAIFTQDTSNLKNVDEPQLAKTKSVCIEFTPTIDIPYDSYQMNEWSFEDEEEDIYREIRESLHSDDYLLGYPSHLTLAYDPTPGTEWISLLTISSDDRLEWCWNDDDKLMLFIKREDLRKLDFSNIKADAG